MNRLTDNEASTVAPPGYTDLRVFLWMLLLAVLAYAPVAFMQYSLKWDMVDCYLPWRYFAADGFAHGVFPLWDPYQSFGYPIYGDLRSVFYPDALLSGLFLGGFGIRTLHVLFILHLAMAGTGMYLLAGHFTRRTDARLLTGSAYLLSGFFTGHGQEMFGITAATWIPFILYHAIHVLRGDGRGGHPPKLALVLFLQLTGGYQALSIMLLYLLLALAAVIVTGRVRAGDRTGWRCLLPRLALWGLAVAASVAALLVTYADIGPHITRFSGMALEKAQVNPFPPKALVSLVMPYAAVADSAAFGTDISMTNGYVGLLPLMAFGLALFRRRTALEHVVLWWGLLCLLASFGPHLPVRQWLFEHAPLMDLFRMPSFFSYYAMLAVLLIGASELGRWLDRPEAGRKQALRGVALLLSVIVALAVYAWRQAPGFAWREGWAATGAGPIAHHVLVQAPVQLLLLGLLGTALAVARRRSGVLRPALFGFLVVEMCVAVRFNAPATVVSLDVPVAHVARTLREQPRGAMVPDLRRTIAENRDDAPDLWPLWRNTGNFTKQVSAAGFNSFQIDAYRRFEDTDLFEATRHGPPLFLSYVLCPEARWATGGAVAGELVVPDSVHAAWPRMALRQAPDDHVAVERFEPGAVHCMVRTGGGAVLTLAQMDHPGWEVYVDGTLRPHAPGHLALISVPLGPGEHAVEFRFSKPWVVGAYIVSYLAVALFIGMALYHAIRERRGLGPKPAMLRAGAVASAAVLLVVATWATRPSYTEHAQRDMGLLARTLDDALAQEPSPVFADVDRPEQLDSMMRSAGPSIEHFRATQPHDVAHVARRLMELEATGVRSVLLAGRGAAVRPEEEELFLSNFPVEQRLVDEAGAYVRRYAKGPSRPSLHSAHQTFEQELPFWKFDASKLERDTLGDRERVWRIGPEQPGSPPFEGTFGAFGAAHAGRLAFSLDALRSTGASDASLYIMIVRAHGEEWGMARRIGSFVPDTARWGRALLVARPPFKPQPDDLIKVFVWNDGQGAVYISDLRFEAFRE